MKSQAILVLITFYILICFTSCKIEQNDYSKIDIQCSDLIVDEYINCICSNIEVGNNIPVRIKKRGSSSRIYPKASYTIEFDGDFSFCGFDADDDWILNAAYIDKTLIRNRLSYNLFLEMSAQNVAPQICFKELILNDIGLGTYLLTEKLTAKKCGLDKQDSAARLFKEPVIFHAKDELVVEESREHYGQKFPKTTDRILSADMFKLNQWLLTVSQEDFDAEIGIRFNLDNLADWMMILLFSNNADGLFRNFYLYKQGESEPYRVAIWDYDESFGRYGDGRLSDSTDTVLDFNNHLLFSKLMRNSEFTSVLKSRWNIHRNQFLKELEIHNRIDSFVLELKPLIAENMEIWPKNGPGYKDAASFDEEITLMKEFVSEQILRLDVYFSKL